MKTKVEKYINFSSAILALGMAWTISSAFGKFFLCLASIVTDRILGFQLYSNDTVRMIFTSYFELGKNYLSHSSPAYCCFVYSVLCMVQAAFFLPCKRSGYEEIIPGAEEYALLAVISTFYHSFIYVCPYYIEDHIFVFKEYLL